MTVDDHESDWVRFDLDTPADVIDRFIEANVSECVEEARLALSDIPLTDVELANSLRQVEAFVRASNRKVLAQALKRLTH